MQANEGKAIERVMLALGVSSVIARDYLEAMDWDVLESVRMYRADHEVAAPAIRTPGGLWLDRMNEVLGA